MKSARAADVLFVIGMLAALAGFFAGNSPARGWMWLAGFTLFAVYTLLRVRLGQPRLRIARASNMFLIAVALSSGYLWTTEPAWLKEALAGAVVLSVVWLMIEQNRSVSAVRK